MVKPLFAYPYRSGRRAPRPRRNFTNVAEPRFNYGAVYPVGTRATMKGEEHILTENGQWVPTDKIIHAQTETDARTEDEEWAQVVEITKKRQREYEKLLLEAKKQQLRQQQIEEDRLYKAAVRQEIAQQREDYVKLMKRMTPQQYLKVIAANEKAREEGRIGADFLSAHYKIQKPVYRTRKMQEQLLIRGYQSEGMKYEDAQAKAKEELKGYTDEDYGDQMSGTTYGQLYAKTSEGNRLQQLLKSRRTRVFNKLTKHYMKQGLDQEAAAMEAAQRMNKQLRLQALQRAQNIMKGRLIVNPRTRAAIKTIGRIGNRWKGKSLDQGIGLI